MDTGSAEINGASIYYEVRGRGPSVVLVPGASGDAGYLEPLAGALANEFTVVSYDRRGNSRSPLPQGWTRTSNAEQAGDLVGLIDTLQLGPAAVFGNSSGAIIALCAVMEHEDAFRGAILHEAPLMSVLEKPDEARGMLQPLIEAAMRSGGPLKAMEAFADFAAGESLRKLPETVVERMLGNAEVFFGKEFGPFEDWQPDEERLHSVSVPIAPLAGVASAPFFLEASEWVAARVGVDVTRAPGAHVGFVDYPEEFADVIRPLLRKIS